MNIKQNGMTSKDSEETTEFLLWKCGMPSKAVRVQTRVMRGHVKMS